MAFERTRSEEVFTGNLLRVRREFFRHDDTGEEVERELAAHPGASVIVAHDQRSVYMVAQPREVVGEQSLLELPAGKIDPDETSEQAARRELVEEIGYAAASWEFLKTVYASPGFTDETFHLFLATDLTERRGEPDEGERILVERFPLGELGDLIELVSDAKTLIGLLLLHRRLGG
ncbi:MAG: NUDIX hydrolase [Thermoleophilaceae bacterium]|nr:NUDIX hydrolase [Thermoleophilaceae bacterium]